MPLPFPPHSLLASVPAMENIATVLNLSLQMLTIDQLSDMFNASANDGNKVSKNAPKFW